MKVASDHLNNQGKGTRAAPKPFITPSAFPSYSHRRCGRSTVLKAGS